MTPKKLVEALYGGAKSTVSVAVACACAGIIIGVLRFTGLGLKFTSAIMSISGGNLLVALVLTMVASIILGMGIPPTAVYVMQAALTAPGLVGQAPPRLRFAGAGMDADMTPCGTGRKTAPEI